MKTNKEELMVGDKITHTEKFVASGIAYSQTRHGKVLARNDKKLLCSLANFGSIVEVELSIDEVDIIDSE